MQVIETLLREPVVIRVAKYQMGKWWETSQQRELTPLSCLCALRPEALRGVPGNDERPASVLPGAGA